jgi:hypothetical protein
MTSRLGEIMSQFSGVAIELRQLVDDLQLIAG